MAQVSLPIDGHLPLIARELQKHGVLVLTAEPGAGKSTRVAPAILDAGILSPPNDRIVLLQPRRVAARLICQRIADERGWAVGERVGYSVRFESRLSSRTRLEVVTEGVLLRRAHSDPTLGGVGCVILDEFHERSIHTDLAIAVLRDLRENYRDDLKLVVMSATMDAGEVSRYLGNAPIVSVPGRCHPLAIEQRSSARDNLASDAARAVADLPRDGGTLVFLPGWQEIREVGEALAPWSRSSGLPVMALHGSMPLEEQSRVVSDGSPRVVLATNVAQTSLTLSGIRSVVDSGLVRQVAYDLARGVDRMDTVRISRASADQRAGRAGREGPGRVTRLWSAVEHNGLIPFDPPEMTLCDLAPAILQVCALGYDRPGVFPWFEKPDDARIGQALTLLELLDIIKVKDGRVQLTARGRRVAGLPLSPRLAALVTAAADRGSAALGATLAALATESDIVVDAPWAKLATDSDLLLRAELLDARTSRAGVVLDMAACDRVRRTRQQVLSLLGSRGEQTRTGGDEGLKLTLLGWPDRVAKRRGGDGLRVALCSGTGGRLSPQVTQRHGEYLVAVDARADSRAIAGELIITQASRIEPEWIEELLSHHITRETTLEYSPAEGRVVEYTVKRYRQLELARDVHPARDAEAAGECLFAALRGDIKAVMAKARGLAECLERLRCSGIPAEPGQEEAWLQEACHRKHTRVAAEDADWTAIVLGSGGGRLRAQLDRMAPLHFALPSGRRAQIEYIPGQGPRMAARIQDFFGLKTHPTVGQGRTPIVLELLAPSHRPVQRTADLPGFWAGSYAQVRRDMRARYPKHDWPEDPTQPYAHRPRTRH